MFRRRKRTQDEAAASPMLVMKVGGHDGTPPSAVVLKVDPAGAGRPPTRDEQLFADADLLEREALRLHRAGDRAGALQHQEWAVAACQRLAAAAPHSPVAARQLGAAHNQHAVFLAMVGRPSDAVDAANRALRVLGSLADGDPATILPIIRGTLGNMVLFLEDSGRHDDAALARNDLAAVERAIVASS